jgi:hypothetical protein
MPFTIRNEAGEYVGSASTADSVIVFSNLGLGRESGGGRMAIPPATAYLLAAKLVNSAMKAEARALMDDARSPEYIRGLAVAKFGVAWDTLPALGASATIPVPTEDVAVQHG